MNKRAVNYMEIEGTCLVWAGSQVYINAVFGNDQTRKLCWQWIKDKFFKSCLELLQGETIYT
jgi:hypothetical protein